MTRSPLVSFIISHQRVLLQTDFAREIWMNPERLIASGKLTDTDDKATYEISCLGDLYPGKLFVFDKTFKAVISYKRIDDRSSELKTFHVEAEETHIAYNPKETTPLSTPQDPFILNEGDIINFQGNSVETTIGIFTANYLFFVYPFGTVIPYLNEEFTDSKMEKLISIPLLEGKITASDVKDKYGNTLSLFGQSTDIFCPGISEKTITIPKEIHDLRERLIHEHRDALKAGDVAVMSDIEQQLIKAYKEYLKGDPSMHFLLKSKYFNVTLKKLFLTQGITEVFGSPGKFDFIDNPMGKGWKQKDLPKIFNEVRAGSYARAVETQNGGVIAKLILRVFQDTRLVEPDCKTKRGEHIHATEDQLKDFIWNYVIEKDGSESLITEETLSSFVGRDLIIRTPGYCKSVEGFCARCFGRTFEVLGQKAFAPVAADFSQKQTNAALKIMHGKSRSIRNASNLNRYLVGN